MLTHRPLPRHSISRLDASRARSFEAVHCLAKPSEHRISPPAQAVNPRLLRFLNAMRMQTCETNGVAEHTVDGDAQDGHGEMPFPQGLPLQ
jgi:hypothetical protein